MRGIVIMAALFAAVVTGLSACGSGDSSQSEACELAESVFGIPTQFYGEDCTAGSNTGCSETFDNCTEGLCEFTGETLGQSICTETCDVDADCPSEIPTCGAGGVCVSSGGGSNGGGSTQGSCSSCLDTCQGFSGCCCGSGCLCESSCTPTCGDG